MSVTAPTPPASPPHRRLPALPSLTGLRFFAALAVFFFHTGLSNSPIPPNAPINPFASHFAAHWYEQVFTKAGYLGVSFFFVLSGFVIAWASRPGEPVRAFLRRRVVKIFPNHLVVWAGAMILFAGATTSWTGWLPNIFLIHTFFPQAAINLGVSPPTWSLGSELLFYVAFPFLIGPLRRIKENRLWWWCAAMVAGMVAIQLITQYLIPDTPKSAISPVSDTQFWFSYLFPPSRMFEFVLGALLARLVAAGRWPRALTIMPSLVLCLLGYLLAYAVPFEYSFYAATIIPVAALIGAVARADVEGGRTRLRGRIMVRLGEISFGFYLCQGIMIFYVRSLSQERFATPLAVLVVVGFFCAALLGGWALNTLVEQPMMRRWSRRRTPAPMRTTALPTAGAGQPSPRATGRTDTVTTHQE